MRLIARRGRLKMYANTWKKQQSDECSSVSVSHYSSHQSHSMIFQQPAQNPSLFWSSCIQDPATSGESSCWERVFAERGAQAPQLHIWIDSCIYCNSLWHPANPACYHAHSLSIRVHHFYWRWLEILHVINCKGPLFNILIALKSPMVVQLQSSCQRRPCCFFVADLFVGTLKLGKLLCMPGLEEVWPDSRVCSGDCGFRLWSRQSMAEAVKHHPKKISQQIIANHQSCSKSPEFAGRLEGDLWSDPMDLSVMDTTKTAAWASVPRW